jgi:hypothetical protein
MKLLLILLLVLALVSVLAAKSKNPQSPGPVRRLPGHALRASLMIAWLRTVRACMATTAVMAVVMSFKFLLIFTASNEAGQRYLHVLKLLVLLALIGLLLRFLLLVLGRLRLRVNQLHQQRRPGAAPLLGSNWSL